jgi:hypothetical protein
MIDSPLSLTGEELARTVYARPTDSNSSTNAQAVRAILTNMINESWRIKQLEYDFLHEHDLSVKLTRFECAVNSNEKTKLYTLARSGLTSNTRPKAESMSNEHDFVIINESDNDQGGSAAKTKGSLTKVADVLAEDEQNDSASEKGTLADSLRQLKELISDVTPGLPSFPIVKFSMSKSALAAVCNKTSIQNSSARSVPGYSRIACGSKMHTSCASSVVSSCNPYDPVIASIACASMKASSKEISVPQVTNTAILVNNSLQSVSSEQSVEVRPNKRKPNEEIQANKKYRTVILLMLDRSWV